MVFVDAANQVDGTGGDPAATLPGLGLLRGDQGARARRHRPDLVTAEPLSEHVDTALAAAGLDRRYVVALAQAALAEDLAGGVERH